MRGLRNSCSAASRLVAPRPTIAATCRSWRVNAVGDRLGASTVVGAEQAPGLRRPGSRAEPFERGQRLAERFVGVGPTELATPLAQPEQGAGPFERCVESARASSERGRERGLGVVRVGARADPRARAAVACAQTSVGRVGLGREHLELAPRRADVADAPVRLDEVRRPPQDAGLAHAAPRDDRRPPVRDARSRLADGRDRARGNRARRSTHTTTASVPVSVAAASAARPCALGVVVEPETGLDARLHGVQPRADARAARAGSPTPRSSRSTYASLQRPRRQSSSARIASATARRKSRPVSRARAAPCTSSSHSARSQFSSVKSASTTRLNTCSASARSLSMSASASCASGSSVSGTRRVGRRRVRLRRGPSRRRRRSAPPARSPHSTARRASATASSMSSANTATFTAYVSSRVARCGIVGFDRVGRLDEDLRALLRPGAVRLELAGGRRDVGARDADRVRTWRAWSSCSSAGFQ